MQLKIYLLGLTITMVASTRTIVYEEESYAVHSGLVFKSTIDSMQNVQQVLDKMRLIEFESDLLQKRDSYVSTAWDFYKNSAISKLNSKFTQLTHRLNNVVNTTIKLVPKVNLDDATTDSNTIRPNHIKRSIEFLGNIISYVTGVPSPSEWRLNQANIGHLKKALTMLDSNQNIQEKRITNVNHRLYDVSIKIESILLSMNKVLLETSTIEHDFKATLVFNTLENGVTQMLSELEYLLNCVDNILFKGHFQLASFYGIDKDFLRNAIIDIQSKHKTLVPIFNTHEIGKYYEMPLTTVTLHDDEIWSTIKIPMVNFNDRFELVDEIGKIHENITELEGLGVRNALWFTDVQERNIFVSRDRIAQCLRYRKTAICEGRKAIVSSRFSNRGNILDNFWGETESHGYFAFINRENLTVQLDCTSEKHDLNLGTKGLIYIYETCSLKSERVRLNRVIYHEGMRVKTVKYFHIRDLSNVDIKRILVHSNAEQLSTTNHEVANEESTLTPSQEIEDEINQVNDQLRPEDKMFYGSIFFSSSALLVLICGIVTGCWLINRNKSGSTTVNITKEENMSQTGRRESMNENRTNFGRKATEQTDECTSKLENKNEG